MPNKRILILGGTGEARKLAALLAAQAGLEPITSLAGATRHPARPEGALRIGGFGGIEGLIAYLRREAIDLLVDATHPFAAQISAQASAAAATLALPALRLERPPWQPEAHDRWTSYATLAEAAEGLPGGSRVLLTIGRKEVAPFFARRDLTLLSRMLEAPSCRLPPNARLLLSPPGETAAEERDLLQREAIDWLVSKNAGGPAAEAKLAAARSLNLPVAMIARPSKPAMETARSAAEVAAMIARRV